MRDKSATPEVDILSVLSQVVQRNTQHYQSDFDYDRETLSRAGQELNMENRVFYWMSRPEGTWCVKEREVFLLESEAHTIWTYHEAEAENICAYRVTVTGLRDGRPVGLLKRLNYKEQVQRVQRAALPVETVELHFPGRPAMTIPYREWEGHHRGMIEQYGTPERVRYAPKNEAELARILIAEHRIQAGKHQKGRSKAPDRHDR